ncbi:MAG: hypothetical protein VCA55_05885, partial [Verrucomicrobiales bacterium]
ADGLGVLAEFENLMTYGIDLPVPALNAAQAAHKKKSKWDTLRGQVIRSVEGTEVAQRLQDEGHQLAGHKRAGNNQRRLPA